MADRTFHRRSLGGSDSFGRLHDQVEPAWRTSALPGPIRRFALDADITHDHLSALLLWLMLGAVSSIAVAAAGGTKQSAVMVVAVVVVPVVVGRRWSGRRTARLVDELPDVIEMIGRSLRSGASLAQALREAVADGPPTAAGELATVVSGIARGQAPDHALRAWVARTSRPEVRVVAASLALASRNEAGTTQALDGVSHSLRDRAALAAEIRSQTAQASASMQALAFLPLLFLGLDVLGSQQTSQFLMREPVGQLCLVAGLVLTAVGWWWMATIVRRRSPR